MRSVLLRIFQSRLFTGGLIMILGGGVGNVVSYLYHIIFGRVIGPVQYGELTTILSLWGIFIALFSSLGMVIMKFSGQNKKGASEIYAWVNKELGFIVLGICLIFSLATPLLSSLLEIEILALLLLVPITFFSVLSLLYGAILQGMQRFGQSAFASTSQVIIRLVAGVVLYFLGLKFIGIIAGLLVTSVFSYLLVKFFIKSLKLPKTDKKPNLVKIRKYAIPVVVASLATGSIFSMDMVLVKYYFTAYDAGLYGAISVLGKIIFYFASPLISVMFTLSVVKRFKGEKTLATFISSIIFTIFLSAGILTIYALFPNPIVNLVYGPEYTDGAKYLFGLGLFSALFTVANFFSSYLLSLGYTRVTYFLAAAAILQIGGIAVLHKTIYEVMFVLLATTLLLIVSLSFYGFMKYKQP